MSEPRDLLKNLAAKYSIPEGTGSEFIKDDRHHVDESIQNTSPIMNRIGSHPASLSYSKKSSKFSLDLFSLLQNREYIAGLCVAQNSLVHTLYRSGKEGVSASATAVESLAPGIIIDGALQDAIGMREAISRLSKKISRMRAQSIILSLPSEHIWMTSLEFPGSATAKDIQGAVELYIEFSLPFSKDEAFIDWELVKVGDNTNVQHVMLGAVRKNVVLPYLTEIERSGMTVIAVESHLMSVARYFGDQGRAIFAIVYPDGLHIGAYRSTLFCFQRFIPWKHMNLATNPANENIPDLTRHMVDAILKEVNLSLRFLKTEVHDFFDVESVMLISSEDLFSAFSAFSPVARGQIPLWRSDEVGGVVYKPTHLIGEGSAMRGLIPRKSDTMISLMESGTEMLYEWKRAVSFSDFFQKITVWLSVFFLLLYAGSYFFILILVDRAQVRQETQSSISRDLILIQDEAKKFNHTLNEVVELTNRSYRWDKFFSAVQTLSNPGITIHALSVEDPSVISMTGVAKNRDALLQLKAAIASSDIFQKIDLPFALTVSRDNIPFRFSIHFREKNYLLPYLQ